MMTFISTSFLSKSLLFMNILCSSKFPCIIMRCYVNNFVWLHSFTSLWNLHTNSPWIKESILETYFVVDYFGCREKGWRSFKQLRRLQMVVPKSYNKIDDSVVYPAGTLSIPIFIYLTPEDCRQTTPCICLFS